MAIPEPRTSQIPDCKHCGKEMYEGASTRGRIFYCPERQTAGTYDKWYMNAPKRLPDIDPSILFLQERRNHEIKMSWKKKYQGKYYGRLKI